MKRKSLAETHPHLKEFTAFLDVLNKESDRGAVLVSVSMLDDLLEKTILAFLLDKPESSKLLSGFNAPLGTFSAKAIAAYSLGLITEWEYRECDRLRKVRNEFAHGVHHSFNDQKIKNICATLDYSARGYKDAPVNAKGQFTTASTSLILMLTNRPHYAALKRLRYGEWKI